MTSARQGRSASSEYTLYGGQNLVDPRQDPTTRM